MGYEIVVARATDKDESMVNSELEYSIISGDDNGRLVEYSLTLTKIMK